jgi:hypothetical protein
MQGNGQSGLRNPVYFSVLAAASDTPAHQFDLTEQDAPGNVRER